uniref:DLG associated protein 5 n=1 Tax=Chelonoidis abingdonii TaxID=106734 RepID=A0A8C0QLJ6_CHEAB
MLFANRYRKDLSTETLRTKVASRKSLIQKENRHKQFERSRQFGLADVNIQLPQERGLPKLDETNEVLLFSIKIFLKFLLSWFMRYKEEKELRKLKEQREKAKRGVFKVGLYRPNAPGFLPFVPQNPVIVKPKEKIAPTSARITRSKAKSQAEQTVMSARSQQSVVCLLFFCLRIGRIRYANKHEVEGNTLMDQLTEVSVSNSKNPTSEVHQEDIRLEKENIPVTHIPAPVKQRTRSFAPQNFMFQPLDGLTTYKVTPMTPSRANAFLTPCLSWKCASTKTQDAMQSSHETSPVSADISAIETKAGETDHDIPYFRNVLASETERLMSHCLQWNVKFELDIPEDAKDLIRTTVGQTRLLIAERFKQFEGLVDNCEFKRGDKETTCTDLDGFWDMVSFQVEDVNKKFDNLSKLQENGWQPVNSPSKRKKVVPSGISKPKQGAAGRTAARNRIAAIRAAMKEKMKQGETAADSAVQEMPKEEEKVVFEAGFFRVESPLKSFPGW